MARTKLPNRPEDQVNALARDLSALWVPADGVRGWIRRNLQFLENLTRERGWSWEDIGRAMTVAGITFSTGKPWTRETISSQVVKARASLLRRNQASRNQQLPETRPDLPPPIKPVNLSDDDDDDPILAADGTPFPN